MQHTLAVSRASASHTIAHNDSPVTNHTENVSQKEDHLSPNPFTSGRWKKPPTPILPPVAGAPPSNPFGHLRLSRDNFRGYKFPGTTIRKDKNRSDEQETVSSFVEAGILRAKDSRSERPNGQEPLATSKPLPLRSLEATSSKQSTYSGVNVVARTRPSTSIRNDHTQGALSPGQVHSMQPITAVTFTPPLLLPRNAEAGPSTARSISIPDDLTMRRKKPGSISGPNPVRRPHAKGVPAIYLQEACLQHRYIRGRDKSNVYERPERLRAVNVGIAAAYAHLEFAANARAAARGAEETIYSSQTSSVLSSTAPFRIIKTGAALDIAEHSAAVCIHGHGLSKTNGLDPKPGVTYAEELKLWCKESQDRISKGDSEIPDDLEQDLYLCPDSIRAFEGALGAVCEAVDDVMTAFRRNLAAAQSSGICLNTRAFVAVRPPGHHCSEDTPMGFGFVNNVMVGAMHACKEHSIRRFVIFDFDLHHGNGTQALVKSINSRTAEKGHLATNADPIFFYGSVHDIMSYPCEERDPVLVREASLSVDGVDGQWLENLHLAEYTSDAQFWKQYDQTYSGLFMKAARFIDGTGGISDDTLVFISCGFDASEHETEDMSRHGRKVPTSFYNRFTRDACAFAETYSNGRIISVLEGGYKDIALTSGSLAHLTALADPDHATDPDWWSLKQLAQVDKVTGKRRGRRPRIDTLDGWVQRTLQIFEIINTESTPHNSHHVVLPPLADDIRLATSEATQKSLLKRQEYQGERQTRSKRAKIVSTRSPSPSEDDTTEHRRNPSSPDLPLSRTHASGPTVATSSTHTAADDKEDFLRWMTQVLAPPARPSTSASEEEVSPTQEISPHARTLEERMRQYTRSTIANANTQINRMAPTSMV